MLYPPIPRRPIARPTGGGRNNFKFTCTLLLYSYTFLNITQSILHYVKESSIDCLVHSKSNSKENIKCFSIGNPNKDEFLYTPNIGDQKQDKDVAINVEKQKNFEKEKNNGKLDLIILGTHGLHGCILGSLRAYSGAGSANQPTYGPQWSQNGPE